MQYNPEIVGNMIRCIRKTRNLSQEVVSGFAVITRPHLSDIEHGKITPKLDTLWRICEALEIRPSELIQMIEESTEQNDETL